MNLHLLAGRMRSDLRGILIYGAAMAAFMLLVVSTFTTVAGSSAMLNMLNQLPSAFKAMFGGDVSRFVRVQGFIGIGFIHPIMIALLSAFAIGVAVRAVAAEIDRGTINLLLARPVRRRELVLTAFVQLLVGLSILALSLVLGVWFGLQTIGRAGSSVPLGDVLAASALTLLFFLTVGSYSLVFSAASSDAGRATLFSAGLTLFFYFLNYLAQLSPEFKSVGNWSIFHHWDPSQVLLSSRLDLADVGLFALLSIALVLFATIIVERRDLAS